MPRHSPSDICEAAVSSSLACHCGMKSLIQWGEWWVVSSLAGSSLKVQGNRSCKHHPAPSSTPCKDAVTRPSLKLSSSAKAGGISFCAELSGSNVIDVIYFPPPSPEGTAPLQLPQVHSETDQVASGPQVPKQKVQEVPLLFHVAVPSLDSFRVRGRTFMV